MMQPQGKLHKLSIRSIPDEKAPVLPSIRKTLRTHAVLTLLWQFLHITSDKNSVLIGLTHQSPMNTFLPGPIV